MNIFKRLIGSLLDKIILIFLFGFLLVFILPFSGETLGIFLGAVLNESTSSYPWTEAAANNVYSLEEIDHEIVYSFTILNMLYYFICELAFKASPGKYIMGGRCVDVFDNKVDAYLSFIRAIVLGVFIFLAIQLRAFMQTINYISIIVLFFFIIDISVLFRKRSLIDIVTGTYYKDVKSLNQKNVEEVKSVSSEANNKQSEEMNTCESTDNSLRTDADVNDEGVNEKSLSPKENEVITSRNENNTDEPLRVKKVKKHNNFLVCIIPLFVCICLFSCLVINEVLPIKHGFDFLKYNTERFRNFDNEKISINKSSTYFSQPNEIGHNEVEDMENWGPIPDGKPISMFIGSGDSVYYYKHYYKYSYKTPVYEYNYWGDKRIVGWNDNWSWDYNWKTAPYNYTYTLTVFRNDDSSGLNDKELAMQFKNKLSGYDNWVFPLSKYSAKINWKKFQLNTPEDNIGVTYSAYYNIASSDSIENVVRSIFFANNRAYMLEIRSPQHAVAIANNILNSFTTNYMQEYNAETITISLCLLPIAIITLILFIYLIVYFCRFRSYIYNGRSTISVAKYYISMLSVYTMLVAFIAVNSYNAYMKYAIGTCHRELAIYCIIIYALFTLSLMITITIYDNNIWTSKNKTAKYLSVFIFCMTIVNTIIFYVDVNSVFNHKICYDDDWWSFFKPIFYTSIVNYIMLPCVVSITKTKQLSEFLTVKWVDRYLCYRNVSNEERKSLLIFLIYPLFTICMLPFGAYVLLYVIPTLAIFVLVLETKGWVKRSTNYQEDNEATKNTDTVKAVFKDYYLILDIKSDASDDCIDRAFNKAMARYNVNSESKKFRKQYVYDLQEAYRVLSSTERLKPEYDEEYLLYLKSDKQVYEYTNINTRRDIKIIQDEILHNNVKPNKVLNYLLKKNVMVLTISIFLIGLLATYVFIKVEDYQSDTSYYIPTNLDPSTLPEAY